MKRALNLYKCAFTLVHSTTKVCLACCTLFVALSATQYLDKIQMRALMDKKTSLLVKRCGLP